jgi:hypothetical protein
MAFERGKSYQYLFSLLLVAFSVGSSFIEVASAHRAFRRIGSMQPLIAVVDEQRVQQDPGTPDRNLNMNMQQPGVDRNASCSRKIADQAEAMRKFIPEFHRGQKLLYGGSDMPYIKKWLKLNVSGSIPDCLKCVVVGDSPS